MSSRRHHDGDAAAFVIAQKLRQRRIARGMTQRQVGEEIGTGQSLISEWENSHCGMSLNGAIRYAEALGLRIVLVEADLPGGVR